MTGFTVIAMFLCIGCSDSGTVDGSQKWNGEANGFIGRANGDAFYTLTINALPSDGGSVSSRPDKTIFPSGTTVTVTATAANGYEFTGWLGASTSTNASVTITMDGPKTLTAKFPPLYILTTNVSPSGSGRVVREPNQTAIPLGTSVTLRAYRSDNNWGFKNWITESNGVTFVNADSTITTFTMPANDAIVTANFDPTFEVYISNRSRRDYYFSGTTVTVIAGTPPTGQQFTNWATPSSNVTFTNVNSDTTTFTMPAEPVTIMAVFGGTFTDDRDQTTYRTTTIGGKTWMAENLNYQTDNSWCYNNADSNCVKYGRLYDWETAKVACPRDWYLPSGREWGDLIRSVNGYSNKGTTLKAKNGWRYEGNGTDEYGFSALPGGFRFGGNCQNICFSSNGGYSGNWWTATSSNSGYGIWADDIGVESDGVIRYNENYGLSVRCVKR